jgi:hypothetical protein
MHPIPPSFCIVPIHAGTCEAVANVKLIIVHLCESQNASKRIL